MARQTGLGSSRCLALEEQRMRREAIMMSNTLVAAGSLSYPILGIVDGIIRVKKTAAELCTTLKGEVDAGSFDRMEIIDSNGDKFRVHDVKILGGIGPFWGYNIFLNRLVSVEV